MLCFDLLLNFLFYYTIKFFCKQQNYYQRKGGKRHHGNCDIAELQNILGCARCGGSNGAKSCRNRN